MWTFRTSRSPSFLLCFDAVCLGDRKGIDLAHKDVCFTTSWSIIMAVIISTEVAVPKPVGTKSFYGAMLAQSAVMRQ